MKTKVMKIYIILFTLLFDVIYCPLKAQVTEAQQVISELEDIISSYSDVDFDVEDQLERMSKVKKDGFLIPYSINNINEQELHALKLLSREQIIIYLLSPPDR